MFDFNFFEPFEKAPKKANLASLVITIVLTLVVGIIVILFGFNIFQYFILTNEVKSIEVQLNDRVIVEAVKEVDELEKKLAAIEGIAQNLEKVNLFVAANDVATEEALLKVTDHVKDNVYITSLSISGSTVTVNGTARTMNLVARFEKSLRDSGSFTSVKIGTISSGHLDTQVFELSETTSNWLYEQWRLQEAAVDDKTVAPNTYPKPTEELIGYTFDLTLQINTSLGLESDFLLRPEDKLEESSSETGSTEIDETGTAGLESESDQEVVTYE